MNARMLKDDKVRANVLREIESELKDQQQTLSTLILATPSGETRNAQTTANIHLMAAITALEAA